MQIGSSGLYPKLHDPRRSAHIKIAINHNQSIKITETKPPPLDSSLQNYYPLASKGAQTHTKSAISCYNKNPPEPRIHLILSVTMMELMMRSQTTTPAIAIQI
jgi:hypothetical protein